VLDAVRDERRDLPADQAAAVELDQAFGNVAGQRQQARTLSGREDDGFVDGHRGWPIAASRRAANMASISSMSAGLSASMHASGSDMGTTFAFNPKRSPARAIPCWIVKRRSSAPMSSQGPKAATIFSPFLRS